MRILNLPFIVMIKLYQLLISPLLGPRCRFYPSCSNYALVALNIHGVLKGGWLSLKRISRCHPGSVGGVVLVPDTEHKHKCACVSSETNQECK